MLVRVRALIFFLLLGLGSQGFSVPFAFTYAGKLLDNSGAPLSGTQSVKITFWTAQTGGSQLAANEQTGASNDTYSVNLVNGVFSQVVNLSAANFHLVFPDDTTGTWVEVEAAGITYPRQQFTAVPYALKVPVDNSTITYNSSGELQVSSIGSVANLNAATTLSTTSAGSAAAPALFFGGDTNTGIYSSGADHLSFSTGGTERVRINSLGNAKFGPYLHFCKGGSNTSQITWNCSQTGTGAMDNIYTPDWAGTSEASMLVMKQRAGGTGSVDIYSKKHGTVSAPADLSTFSHIASFDADNARVGMGTLSPSSKLEVVGTTSGVISAVQSGSTNSQIISAQFSGGNVGSTGAASALMRVTSNSGFRPLASFNDKAIFDANGNLGIGTAVPATQLHVVGASNAAYSNIFVQDTTAMASQVGGGIVFAGKYHTDGSYARYGQIRGVKENSTSGNYLSALTFSTNDMTTLSEKMRISSSGNVGIGTTAPVAKLDLGDPESVNEVQAVLAKGLSPSIGFRLVSKTGESFNALGETFKLGLSYYDTDNAYINFHRGNSSTGGFLTFTTDNDTEQLRISNNGNVILSNGNLGIGTSYPVEKLETKGNMYISKSTGLPIGSSAGELLYGFSSSSTYNWPVASIEGIQSGGGINVIDGNDQFGALLFKTANNNSSPTEKVRISANGNVGIGTDSPAAKLDVAGEVKLGNTSATCGATTEGSIRYNSTSKLMEFCNGTAWTAYGTSGRTSCPSGFTMIGTSGSADAFCISTSEESGRSWLNAVTNCYNKSPRARLCSSGEWVMACVSGLVSGMTGNWEWVADMTYRYNVSPNGAMGLGSVNCASGTNTGAQTNKDNTYASRCCFR